MREKIIERERRWKRGRDRGRKRILRESNWLYWIFECLSNWSISLIYTLDYNNCLQASFPSNLQTSQLFLSIFPLLPSICDIMCCVLVGILWTQKNCKLHVQGDALWLFSFLNLLHKVCLEDITKVEKNSIIFFAFKRNKIIQKNNWKAL